MPWSPTKRLPALTALTLFLVLVIVPAAGAAGPSTLEPSFEGAQITSGIAGSEIWGMDSGDLNDDGRADVVTANINESSGPAWVGVQFAEASGTLAEPVAYPLPSNGALYVTLGDFDGDLDLDIVAIRESGASLLLNDGDGGFGVELPLAVATTSMFSAAAGDFDLDGNLDLAISDGPEARIFLGAGDGSFAETTPVAYEAESWGNTIVVADFEGDGSADLAVTQFDSGLTEILSSNDDGSFTSRGSYGSPCGCAWGLAVADFDLDGDDDLVVTERISNLIYSIIAGPNHTFSKGADVQIPDGVAEADPIWIAAGDLNGDGYPDVATSDYQNESVTSLVGDGTGGFTFGETIYPLGPASGGFSSHADVIDDFNDDGRLDVAAGAQLGPVVDYVNDGMPLALAEPASPDFGPQTLGTTSAPLTLHLENNGRAPLAVASALLNSGKVADFAVDASDCLTQTALVGVGCDLGLTFDPSALGSSTATLEVKYNRPGAGGRLKIVLKGSGVLAPPRITRSPDSIDFGDQNIATTSASRTITIGNAGVAPLDVSGIAVVGLEAAAFDLGPAACAPTTIVAGAECRFTVAFKPASAGPRQAQVVISSNDPAGDVAVTIKGNGTQPEGAVIKGNATQPEGAVAPAPTPAPRPVVSYSKKPSSKIEIEGNLLKRIRLAFKSNQGGSTFQCSLDRKPFAPCRSPQTLKNVKLGQHTFRVRAINGAGTVGAPTQTKFRLVRKQ